MDRPASHPRFWGSYPRVLGRYVREQGHLSWEDAVRKMTGLPAATIGLVDRGLVSVGHAADLTVVDPATVIDHATFQQPNAPSTGIRHVLVNGRFALREGHVTGEQAGRALRRTAMMPSRPMTGGDARTLVARGALGDVSIDVDLSQPAGAREAGGRIRVTQGDRTVEATAVGAIQSWGGWAASTAVAFVDGRALPVTVIVDDDAPGRPGRYVSVRVGDMIAATGAWR